jgi:glycerol-3-phosphate dehydrogenase
MARYDLAIIGGGINGAGIARDAAGRGFATLLVEQGDLGGATSSASTGLIHGGLRYLEHYEFRLVAESLAEREVVLRIAPHIVRPLQFVLPHEPHLRPAWMIRAGLFLYDHLGGRRTLPGSRGVRLAGTALGTGLKPEFRNGFSYYDAAVDDARLVIITVRAAADRGAHVRPRTRCVEARRTGDAWRLRLRDADGVEDEAEARVLVNAAGPWVREVLDHAIHLPSPGGVRLVKGSHMVVPRLYEGEHAYILQNPDGRVIFMIPYEERFTCIGTTDVAVESPEAPRITDAEVTYLCSAASRYAARAIAPADVVHTWSGIRPLYDDGQTDPSSITRDYHFALDSAGPPLLSIYGGKLTTYRKLAEAALRDLAPWLPPRPSWTADVPLPGGDFGGASFDELLATYRARYPRLDHAWLRRLLRRQGSSAADVLGDARDTADLGEDFGGGLFEREVDYLVRREWARAAEDVIWRRTKTGLFMRPDQRARLAARMGHSLSVI